MCEMLLSFVPSLMYTYINVCVHVIVQYIHSPASPTMSSIVSPALSVFLCMLVRWDIRLGNDTQFHTTFPQSVICYNICLDYPCTEATWTPAVIESSY